MLVHSRISTLHPALNLPVPISTPGLDRGTVRVNCLAQEHELEVIVKVKTASNSQSVKRSHGNRSPSGSTPDPKAPNDISQEPQEEERRQPTNRAKKSSLSFFKHSTPLELFNDRLNSSRNP